MAGKAHTTVVTDALGNVASRVRVPAVAREQTQERQGNAIQQHVADATVASRSSPRAAGSTTIAAVAFQASATVTLSHRLGRPFVGWQFHTAKLAAPTLFQAASQPDTSKFLVLTNSSATVFTCDIEVW